MAEAEVIRECNVIFLGDGSVGKSSLIDRLIDRESKLTPGFSSPTNGVRMRTWQTTINEPGNEHSDSKPISLRFMDFGGQEIMHSIHRCFLTENTVYVVVCESRMDTYIDYDAVRWLETVKVFAPLSPVILALNKADLNENVSVNEKDLKRRYSNLKRILKTTARSEESFTKSANCPYCLDNLEEAIKTEATKCENNIFAGQDWIAVKQELENMRMVNPAEYGGSDAGYRGYITETEYKMICVRYGVADDEDQRALLEWLRDLGVVYTYEKNAYGEIDADLNGVRVLDPQWLSNGIYRIILRAPVNMFLTNAQIRETLGNVYPGDSSKQRYSMRRINGKLFDEPDYILHVMRKFGLSHQADDNGVAKEMIPSRFTKNPPDTVDDFPVDSALHVCWKGRYLPNNVVHRLMIRRFHELRRDCLWRTGAVFLSNEDRTPANVENYDYQAMVKLNDESLDLYVAVTNGGKHLDPRKYLWHLRQDILEIMAEINLFPDEYPCCKLPGEGGKEVEICLASAIKSICASSFPYEVKLFANYTSLAYSDRDSGIMVDALDILNNIYLHSADMLNEYRLRYEFNLTSEIPQTSECTQQFLSNQRIHRRFEQLLHKAKAFFYIALALLAAVTSLSVLVLLITGRLETESIPQFLGRLFGLLK